MTLKSETEEEFRRWKLELGVFDLEFVIWNFGHIALGNDELKYEPESPYYLCHWYSIPLRSRSMATSRSRRLNPHPVLKRFSVIRLPGSAFLFSRPLSRLTMNLFTREIFQIRLPFSPSSTSCTLFRMNNRFTSTMETDTCFPVRYVKEVESGGVF